DNRFDGRYLRGQSGPMPNHRFRTDFIWDLPFGRSKKFGNRMNRGVDDVIGGWTVSSVMIFQSSGLLTPFVSSHCVSGTNCYTSIVERPDAVPGQYPNSGANTTEQWFNTGAFTTQAFFRGSTPIFAGRFGNAGKVIIDGPGMTSIDVGAFKDFSIR